MLTGCEATHIDTKYFVPRAKRLESLYLNFSIQILLPSDSIYITDLIFQRSQVEPFILLWICPILSTLVFLFSLSVNANSLHSCPTLCIPMDCSLQGSSVCGILQARTLKWVVISLSRGSSRAKVQSGVSSVSCIGRQVLYHWRHPGSFTSFIFHLWYRLFSMLRPLIAIDTLFIYFLSPSLFLNFTHP